MQRIERSNEKKAVSFYNYSGCAHKRADNRTYE